MGLPIPDLRNRAPRQRSQTKAPLKMRWHKGHDNFTLLRIGGAKPIPPGQVTLGLALPVRLESSDGMQKGGARVFLLTPTSTKQRQELCATLSD